MEFDNRKDIIKKRTKLGYKSYNLNYLKQVMKRKQKIIKVSHNWLEVNGKFTQYRISLNNLDRFIIQYCDDIENLNECKEILIHSSESDIKELEFIFKFCEYAEKNVIIFQGPKDSEIYFDLAGKYQLN